MVNNEREVQQRNSVELTLEVTRLYLKLILIVVILGCTCFISATFVGHLSPDMDMNRITSEVEMNGSVMESVMTLSITDYAKNLELIRSLAELNDRFDLPNQMDIFYGSNRLLLRGIPDAEIGEGNGSHSVQEYRPFIYDTVTDEVIMLSDESEVPMEFSPNGQYAILESIIKNGEKWATRYKMVEIDEENIVEVLDESFFDFPPHFHFSPDSTKLTVDTNFESPVYYFNLQTGKKTELQAESLEGESLVYPDPVGEGIYYLDRSTRQIIKQSIETGQQEVVMNEFIGNEFTLSPDGQILIYEFGEELWVYQIASQQLQNIDTRVKEYVVQDENILIKHFTKEQPDKLITFGELENTLVFSVS